MEETFLRSQVTQPIKENRLSRNPEVHYRVHKSQTSPRP